MKLWHISQSINKGYDTFDSAVVTAETEEQARTINPYRESFDVRWDTRSRKWIGYRKDGTTYGWDNSAWVDPSNVEVVYLGEAKEGLEPGVICASFNPS